jgi:acyl-CoA dehydrogenase
LRKYASGSDANVDASIAKIFAADAAMRVTSHAVQLLGGYGYTREFPVERWFRDARLFSIGGGTSQIQKLIVARALM